MSKLLDQDSQVNIIRVLLALQTFQFTLSSNHFGYWGH